VRGWVVPTMWRLRSKSTSVNQEPGPDAPK
jgi:hypothetical protein